MIRVLALSVLIVLSLFILETESKLWMCLYICRLAFVNIYGIGIYKCFRFMYVYSYFL